MILVPEDRYVSPLCIDTKNVPVALHFIIISEIAPYTTSAKFLYGNVLLRRELQIDKKN